MYSKKVVALLFSAALLVSAQTVGADTKSSQPITLKITRFEHTPHGGKAGHTARIAQARIRGDRLVLSATGPSSKEGAYFVLRFSIPLDLAHKGAAPAAQLGMYCAHGGESGLRPLSIQKKAGSLRMTRDDKTRSIQGTFTFSLSLLASKRSYGLASQTLTGRFAVPDCGWLLARLDNQRAVAISRTDIDEILPEQGYLMGVVSAKQLKDGSWLVHPRNKHGWTMTLDRLGNNIDYPAGKTKSFFERDRHNCK